MGIAHIGVKKRRRRRKWMGIAPVYEIAKNYKFVMVHSKCVICGKHSVYIQNECKTWYI